MIEKTKYKTPRQDIREPRETKEVSDRQILEVSLPPQITRRILEDDSLFERLSRGDEVNLEIASGFSPAHAFEFATWYLDSSTREIMQKRVVEYFNNQPEKGILLRFRGDVVKGFITSHDNKDLENTIGEIGALMDEMKQLSTSPKGGFAFFISEAPEREVQIGPMGKKDSKNPAFILNPVGDTGLTCMSWASKKLKESGDIDPSGGVYTYWVSSEDDERIRERFTMMREHIVTKSENADDPLRVESPKAHYSIFIRKLDFDNQDVETESQISQTERITNYWDKNFELFQKLPVSQQKELLSFGIVGLPLYDHDLPSRETMEISEGGEKFKMEVTGEHVQLKLDYSGMSKLVAQGKNIGPYLRNIFSDMVTIIDNDEATSNYYISLEGDALVLLLMTPSLKGKEIVDHFLRIREQLTAQFNLRIMKDLYGDSQVRFLADEEVGLHEIGLKLVASISDKPITLTFQKGGVSTIDDPEFNKWEDEVESRSKRGGYVAGLVCSHSDKRICSSIVCNNIAHTSEKDIFLFKDLTPYEIRAARFRDDIAGVGGEIDRDSIRKIEEDMFAALNSVGSIKDDDSDSEISNCNNNELTSAKILHIFEKVKDMKGVDLSKITDIIRNNFTETTSNILVTLWKSLQGEYLGEEENDLVHAHKQEIRVSQWISQRIKDLKTRS